MNRRTFLMTAAALGLTQSIPGCRRRPADLPDRAAIRAEQSRRADHLDRLQACRIADDSKFTTPTPALDVLNEFPQLKALAKPTMRLHPRYANEPGVDQSKLGGLFIWHAKEPWPTDSRYGLPMIGVLQLRVEDAPPQFPFPPKTDLMQLFWSAVPVDGLPEPLVVWQNLAAMDSLLSKPPEAEPTWPPYVPVPCRLFPEQVMEFPPRSLVPGIMREQLDDWQPSDGELAEQNPKRLYRDQLSTAPGTKVGGWPRWNSEPATPTCPNCDRLTDYLLTIDPSEWSEHTAERWRPREDRERVEAEADAYRRAANVAFAADRDKPIHIYICRRCEHLPAYSLLADETPPEGSDGV